MSVFAEAKRRLNFGVQFLMCAASVFAMSDHAFSQQAPMEIDPAALELTAEEYQKLEEELEKKPPSKDQSFDPFSEDAAKSKQPNRVNIKKKISPKTTTKKPQKPTSKSSSQSRNNSRNNETQSYFDGRSEMFFSGSLENIFTVTEASPTLNFADLSDDQLLVPRALIAEQIYPTVKISSGKGFLFNARPRIEISHTRSMKKNGKDQLSSRFEASAGEMFVSVAPSARFSLVAGKQNFQWGIAEMTSPSNWIFKPRRLGETLVRTPQTEVETRDLFRLNLSAGQRFNLVAMAEYEPEKGDLPRIYSGRRGLVKPEFSWNNGADFFGLVLGGAEKLRFPFIGEYFSLNITSAISIYFDIAHFKGGEAVKPVLVTLPGLPEEDALIAFDQPYLEKDSFNHEAVLGTRLTGDHGIELKIEGYFNSQGYNSIETQKSRILADEKSPLSTLFFSPAVEYRYKTAVLASLRVNEFGHKKRMNAFMRYLKSLKDSSGALLIYGEYALSDNAVAFLSGGGYHGQVISDSAFPQRAIFTLGHKYVW